MAWGAVMPIADELVSRLEDACARIRIAGSLRRAKPQVHDIELVAIPRVDATSDGLLFEDVRAFDHLSTRIDEGLRDGWLRPRSVISHRRDGSEEAGTKLGPAYKALEYLGIPVDLFITDEERWGCIFALRTGPGDWNERLVTDCKRYFRQVQGGRVLHLGRVVATPTEEAFFDALGVAWVEPQDRRPEALRFDPELLRAGAA